MVDGPAKFESPVENGGKHPMIYRVSTIRLVVVQDFLVHDAGHWPILATVSTHVPGREAVRRSQRPQPAPWRALWLATGRLEDHPK